MSLLLRAIKRMLKKMPLLTIAVVFFFRIIRGWQAYKKILVTCPPEQWNICFMDYDGSGDTYLSCAYLQAHDMIGSNVAFVASGGLSLKIAKLFNFGYLFQLHPKEALTVRFMERFYGCRLKILPLLYESEYLQYSGILRQSEGINKLNFMDFLKIGFEANLGFAYDDEPLKQPDFLYNQEELNNIFQAYGLAYGKTVLIAPYAGKQNMWDIPMDFYKGLVCCLKNAGFVVCTNSAGQNFEPPVPGTIPIFLQHKMLKPFCEQAGYFIGLRSGLCDIVSGAMDCKKIIIYSTNVMGNMLSAHWEFFSLKNMGLCDDVCEIVYSEDCDLNELEDKIIRYFV